MSLAHLCYCRGMFAQQPSPLKDAIHGLKGNREGRAVVYKICQEESHFDGIEIVST